MIVYEYACFRVGCGDAFRCLAVLDHETHPIRLRVAHTDAARDKVVTQFELQLSPAQALALQKQLSAAMRAYETGEGQEASGADAP